MRKYTSHEDAKQKKMKRAALNNDDWINEGKPLEYSLVKMLLTNGKIVYGWWSGSNWVSRKLGKEKVVAWKKHHGEY